MRRWVLAILIVIVGACGGSSTAPSGPSASSVSVQQSDVPKGMVRCDVSGDIAGFIQKEQSQDPGTAHATSAQWTDAQAHGAMAAYAALYTDSSANCSAIKSSATDISAATYKLVVNIVVQYKSEKAATDAFTNESVFGFTPSTLGGGAALRGSGTGLSANSVSMSESFGNQAFYIAFWQNKAFVAILVVVNIDAGASKKIAMSENGRIK
jgi:hypothetical protein